MKKSKIYLISGGKASGKTSSIKEIIHLLKQNHLSIDGIYSEGFWENGLRSHYEVVSIGSGERRLLCSRENNGPQTIDGRYAFQPEGISFGSEILLKHCGLVDLLIIDEVGMLETKKLVWHEAIRKLLDSNQSMIWAVRDEFVSQVTNFYKLENAVSFHIQEYKAAEISSFILNDIKVSL